jgi:hypothetical protein
MAAYPDLPLSRDSKRTIINGTKTDMADDGTRWARNFYTVAVYKFNLIHPGLTQTQSDDLEDLYWSNPAGSVLLTYKKDGIDYNCQFISPPDIDHEKGIWWTAVVQLWGNKA